MRGALWWAENNVRTHDRLSRTLLCACGRRLQTSTNETHNSDVEAPIIYRKDLTALQLSLWMTQLISLRFLTADHNAKIQNELRTLGSVCLVRWISETAVPCATGELHWKKGQSKNNNIKGSGKRLSWQNSTNVRGFCLFHCLTSS